MTRDSTDAFVVEGWDSHEFTEVRPGIFGATVETPQLTVTYYRYSAGSEWETHDHPEDQITTVLTGEIDFVVGGAPVHLTEGQVACMPGGVPHSASVGDAPVTTLNVYTLRGSRG